MKPYIESFHFLKGFFTDELTKKITSCILSLRRHAMRHNGPFVGLFTHYEHNSSIWKMQILDYEVRETEVVVWYSSETLDGSFCHHRLEMIINKDLFLRQ